jgi:hypothetical protein
VAAAAWLLPHRLRLPGYAPFFSFSARSHNVPDEAGNSQEKGCSLSRIAFAAGLVLAAGGVGTLLSLSAISALLSTARLVQQLAMVSQSRRITDDMLPQLGPNVFVPSLRTWVHRDTFVGVYELTSSRLPMSSRADSTCGILFPHQDCSRAT